MPTQPRLMPRRTQHVAPGPGGGGGAGVPARARGSGADRPQGNRAAYPVVHLFGCFICFTFLFYRIGLASTPISRFLWR